MSLCKEPLSLQALAEIIVSTVQKNPLKESPLNRPFVIGITGASGAGKTTLSLLLQNALEKNFPPKKVSVIQSDNFIYSNAYLTKKKLMKRKGFPESFNVDLFKNFLENVIERKHFPFHMPHYSQVIKDIMPGKTISIEASDIYIIEGVNLFFQYNAFHAVDYIDFSIYLDTEPHVVKERALKRFFEAYAQSKHNPTPYFEQFSEWDETAIQQYAEDLWKKMDEALLKMYIEPHRSMANLILKSYT